MTVANGKPLTLEQATAALDALRAIVRDLRGDALLTQKANLETQLAEERAKREAAEEVCETWKSRHAIVKGRADKAERELAEMRQILLGERVQATKGAWAASEMQKRVEGLQALVDAATEFRFGRFRVLPQYIAERGYLVEDQYGDWLVFDIPKHEAIALARDLAAKEKEPT